jgi:hypothetical protein
MDLDDNMLKMIMKKVEVVKWTELVKNEGPMACDHERNE